jgi:methionine sulfoxide reductase heme-binding subunit
VTNPSTHLFWITSRAAGTAALVLSSATICFGLVMGARIRGASGSGRRTIHETLSLAVMIAIAVHGLSLVGDKYLHPSVLDVTVPFALSYKTLPTSLGIVSGWGLIVLGLSYYLRGRIGVNRWKLIHRFTVLAWVGGVVHAFTEGTDAGQRWFVILAAVCVAPVLTLLAVRVGSAQRQPTGRASAPRTSPRASAQMQ